MNSVEIKRKLYRNYNSLRVFNYLFLFLIFLIVLMGETTIAAATVILYAYFLIVEKEVENELQK